MRRWRRSRPAPMIVDVRAGRWTVYTFDAADGLVPSAVTVPSLTGVGPSWRSGRAAVACEATPDHLVLTVARRSQAEPARHIARGAGAYCAGAGRVASVPGDLLVCAEGFFPSDVVAARKRPGSLARCSAMAGSASRNRPSGIQRRLCHRWPGRGAHVALRAPLSAAASRRPLEEQRSGRLWPVLLLARVHAQMAAWGMDRRSKERRYRSRRSGFHELQKLELLAASSMPTEPWPTSARIITAA